MFTEEGSIDSTWMVYSIIDEQGKSMARDGDPRDLTDYWFNLVDRLEEGLGERDYAAEQVEKTEVSPPVLPKTKYSNSIVENFYGE